MADIFVPEDSTVLTGATFDADTAAGILGRQIPDTIEQLDLFDRTQNLPELDAGSPLTTQDAAVLPQVTANEAARAANAARPTASVLESMGAALTATDAAGLYYRWMRPHFAEDPNFNRREFLEERAPGLNKDEYEMYEKYAVSEAAAEHALNQIENLRTARQAMGDHPGWATVTTFADPAWIAAGAATGGFGYAAKMGVLARGVAGAGVGAAITTQKYAPVSDSELVLSMALNSGVAMLFGGRGGKLRADPAHDTSSARRMLHRMEAEHKKNATSETPPENPLEFGAKNTDYEKTKAAVDRSIAEDNGKRGLGYSMMWNIAKTFDKMGPVGQEVAALILDRNWQLGTHSMESYRQALLDRARVRQMAYEQKLQAMMQENGASWYHQLNPFTANKAYKVQRDIEDGLFREMMLRERRGKMGPVLRTDAPDPRILAMADDLDVLHAELLQAQKAAGVIGADAVKATPGWLHRNWSSSRIEGAQKRLEALGYTPAKARELLRDMLAVGFKNASKTPMEESVAKAIATATIGRAMRKGYHEDTTFMGSLDSGKIKELQTIMAQDGIDPETIAKATRTLERSMNDSGKSPHMKHRMDIDYTSELNIGGQKFTIFDMLDTRVSNLVDRYIQGAATDAAFALKGLKSVGDVDALRSRLSHSIANEKDRAEAVKLFDNMVAYYKGMPSGGDMTEALRLMAQYNRAVSLAWSGLWQPQEFANISGMYGARKTIQAAMANMPGLRRLMRPSKNDAESLELMLSDASVASMRIRPFIARFEDNFDLNTDSGFMLSSQTLGQAVPYANVMRYIHHWQAKTSANLLLDRVRLAIKGNKKAQDALAQYGLGSDVMNKLKNEVSTHGWEVDKWDDLVWMETHAAFSKIMDSGALRARLGDLPASMVFDSAAKFLTTFRSFSIMSHNKVMAGNLERGGVGALGLVMMHQIPLALLTVQAQAVIKTGQPLSTDDAIKRSFGLMGSMGLFSEMARIASGEATQVGTPGLIMADRFARTLSQGAKGDTDAAVQGIAQLIPILNANPAYAGIISQWQARNKQE